MCPITPNQRLSRVNHARGTSFDMAFGLCRQRKLAAWQQRAAGAQFEYWEGGKGEVGKFR